MGARGPAPKPTVLKVLHGNPGKRPLPMNEPKPRPVAPAAPKWLSPVALAEWKRITPELEHIGLLTGVDMAAMACYCQAYGDMVAAREDIATHGYFMVVGENAYQQARPAVALQQKSMALIKTFAAEFGCSPSSRGRINLPGQAEPDDDLLD